MKITLVHPGTLSQKTGLKCIYKKCINSWNDITTEININESNKFANKLNAPDIDLLRLSRNQLKSRITEHILYKYDE